LSPAHAAIRVLLVEDDKLLASLLDRQLRTEPDFHVVGQATTVEAAREMARERVDVALMDYILPDGTGAEVTRAIKARWPAARVVMLTSITDDETILESIQAGADGYLMKGTTLPDEVVRAVRAAYSGEILLPRSVIVGIAQRVAAARERGGEQHRPYEQLTPREIEILRALTEGHSTKDICELLGIAPNTLRTHVQNVMSKLHAHSKLEAVSTALRLHLVEPPRAE
jgi:DNA-binding NarL/FixJ family response regulator